MSSKAVFSTIIALSMGVAMASPAFAQAKKEEKPSPHCSPKIAEMCDKLPRLAAVSEETWKVAAYGSTACANSRTVESERKRRRDRAEYEERLAEAAKKNETEYTPWDPPETTAAFTTRTNRQCDESYTFYCAAMKKEADALKDATVRTDTLDVVAQMCGGESTAEAAPAAAPAAAAPQNQ